MKKSDYISLIEIYFSFHNPNICPGIDDGILSRTSCKKSYSFLKVAQIRQLFCELDCCSSFVLNSRNLQIIVKIVITFIYFRLFLFLFLNSCHQQHTKVSNSARGGRIRKFENSEWKVFLHINFWVKSSFFWQNTFQIILIL